MMPESSGTSAVPINTDSAGGSLRLCIAKGAPIQPVPTAVPRCGHPVVWHSGSPAEFMRHLEHPFNTFFYIANTILYETRMGKLGPSSV